MGYTALYRKWRSKDFDDIVGQDAITRSFKNQVSSGRVGHAYLFCGTRGTGKTSLAKILARAVNCEHPINGNPCNECKNCKSILSNTSINVYEMDAASNNGVDDIRLIREQVEYPPVDMKYKVYIIDEVHMLSPSAFNAFLKTLEEPPEYVIFILATTEPNALPITILSRCQRYDFKRISVETIAKRLEMITKEENIAISEEALDYIARMGDGSMRDAVSLLDQCASYDFQQEISYEDALKVLGAVDTAVFSDMISALRHKNIQAVMENIATVLEQGKELSQYVSDLLSYFRNMMLAKSVKNLQGLVDLSEENKNRLLKDAGSMPMEEILRGIRLFSELLQQFRYANQKRVLLETCLMKLAYPETEGTADALQQRMQELEEGLRKGVRIVEGASVLEGGKNLSENPVETEQEKTIKLPQAQFEDYQELKKNWAVVPSYFPQPMRGALVKSRIYPGKDKKSMLIIPMDDVSRNILSSNNSLEEVLKEKYRIEYHFHIGAAEQRERSTRYISDEELEKIDMPIEIAFLQAKSIKSFCCKVKIRKVIDLSIGFMIK